MADGGGLDGISYQNDRVETAVPLGRMWKSQKLERERIWHGTMKGGRWVMRKGSAGRFLCRSRDRLPTRYQCTTLRAPVDPHNFKYVALIPDSVASLREVKRERANAERIPTTHRAQDNA
jgi:hypothetical protein